MASKAIARQYDLQYKSTLSQDTSLTLQARLVSVRESNTNPPPIPMADAASTTSASQSFLAKSIHSVTSTISGYWDRASTFTASTWDSVCGRWNDVATSISSTFRSLYSRAGRLFGRRRKAKQQVRPLLEQRLVERLTCFAVSCC